MRKLSLHLEDLAVDSFATAPVDGLRGTVRGHGDSSDCSYGSPQYTACEFTCAIACGQSAECTPACPGGSGGCTNPPTTTTTDPTAATACDLSCEFPC